MSEGRLSDKWIAVLERFRIWLQGQRWRNDGYQPVTKSIKERAKEVLRGADGDSLSVDVLLLKSFVQELANAPEPEIMQVLTDTDIARIYRNIFGGNRWPSDCYPEFARAIESAALGAAQQEPPADLVRDEWRELCRRLYVELFH